MDVQRFIVLQTKLIQDCRLEIVGGHDVFDGSVPELIRLTECHTRFESAAGHPNAEALAVMIAASFFGRTVFLCDWEPSDLAPPMHNGGVEHSALLEILDQGCCRLIRLFAYRLEPTDDSAVIVPGLSAMKQLDKANAALDQTSGNQAASAILFGLWMIQPVHSVRCGRFFFDVERFGGRSLHAGSQFIACDPCLQLRFAGMRFEMPTIQIL